MPKPKRIRIRTLEPEDIDSLAHICRSAAFPMPDFNGDASIIRTLVAEIDGQPAGSLSLCLEPIVEPLILDASLPRLVRSRAIYGLAMAAKGVLLATSPSFDSFCFFVSDCLPDFQRAVLSAGAEEIESDGKRYRF